MPRRRKMMSGSGGNGEWLWTKGEFQTRRCGFAAGCEARLCLAAQPESSNGLCPWFGLCPKIFGQRPNQGPTSINSNGEA